MTRELIDRTYESAVDPTLWPGVLEKTGCARQAEAAALLAVTAFLPG